MTMQTDPTPAEARALLPCPFCGHDDPEIYTTGDASGTVRGGCRNADCVLFDCFPGDYRDRDHFAEWWNTRIPSTDARRIPDGYALVPMEPSDVMLAAGRKGWWRSVASITPEASMYAAWSDMLASTPSTDARSRGQAEERERCARIAECADTWNHPYVEEAANRIAAAIRSGETPVGEGRGWRGIESAPRDGTRVLLFTSTDNDKDRDYVETICEGEHLHQVQIGSYERDGWSHLNIGTPTHWRPLPDAPAAEVGHG